jgi:uncharacterized protein
MIDHTLIQEILKGYRLPLMGTHGLPHWGRVLETGLKLAERTGANPEVVVLFAVFHDARRRSETSDQGHGQRGAKLASKLRAKFLSLSDEDFALFTTACTHHTDGTTEGDITVQTCWDADRLDLRRVFIVPKNELLCTPVAKDKSLQDWACKRSLTNYCPTFVTSEWLVE